ncbi:hypothetical protein Z517_07787 [Fonsecaea pedrosoi CBS 271.37]|uniref:Uncharacterized protein n=1 Tax=Fonsecaea pedrosoi CBS 271.37 TaxID=1442368 RepID=A0A0D2GZV6_9EURO|nr:uncharacterized protein Z517_07787 [Fonsecaea pedrosoi CBS 271.37]KIW77954.1 hypothetical protein Z517_07787 [Fonsecaea pedrosoi CBS 271.37]
MVSTKVLLANGLIALSPTFVLAQSACPRGQWAYAASVFADYSPALSYCSSNYPVSPETYTATFESPVTATVETSTATSTVATVTITADTTTITVTVLTVTDTITATDTFTTTTTETGSVTSTTTVRHTRRKRALHADRAWDTWSAAAATTPSIEPSNVQTTTTTPTIEPSDVQTTTSSSTGSPDPTASAWSALLSQASSIIEAVCACIETPSTTTTTVTTGATTSVTAVTTVSVTETETTTTTPAVISPATATTTTTSTSTSTVTDTATTTTTVLSTETAAPLPACNSPDGNVPEVGGCIGSCFCDSDADGVNAYCTLNFFCGSSCTTDADCALDSFCTARADAIANCGGPICESTSGCGSTLTKRGLFGLGGEDRAGRIMARVTEARSSMTTPLKQYVRATNVHSKKVQGRGTGIFAAHDIAPKSEVMFVARPLMVALETRHLQSRCYYCYSSPWDPSHSPRNPGVQALKTCSGCKVVKFCDQKCQTRAWSEYHRLECKLYGRLHPRILPSTARALIRLLKQHKAHLLLRAEWDQLLALETHREDLIKAEDQRFQDSFIMMKGVKSYCGTDHDEETIFRIACVLLINSFTLTTPTFDSVGLILHPKPALLNHSCEPNAFVRFDIPPDTSHEDFPSYGSISVRALRPIARDEEVTLSYIDTTFPFEKRQEELRTRYFFTCTCSLCSQGRDCPRDKFHLDIPVGATDTTQPAMNAIVAEAGDQAEQFFTGLQSQSGEEYTQIDRIRHIMRRLAQTRSWPLHRYPWPQLRQQLLLGLIASQKYSEALLHSAVLARLVHPVMFEQEHHPIRVVQLWQFWNLCRQCLESLMLRERSPDAVQYEPRRLGLLSCVLIDDIHRIMNDGIRSDGKLELLVDAALQNVKGEGGFWDEYQQKKTETRKKTLLWVDEQVKALLRSEEVVEDIIELAFTISSTGYSVVHRG